MVGALSSSSFSVTSPVEFGAVFLEPAIARLHPPGGCAWTAPCSPGAVFLVRPEPPLGRARDCAMARSTTLPASRIVTWIGGDRGLHHHGIRGLRGAPSGALEPGPAHFVRGDAPAHYPIIISNGDRLITSGRPAGRRHPCGRSGLRTRAHRRVASGACRSRP